MLLLIFTLNQFKIIDNVNQYITDQTLKVQDLNSVHLDPCDADLAKMENYDKCIDFLSRNVKELHIAIKDAKQAKRNSRE
tara:strand:+ start:229 stop:468 length:240 start_codon:yes stop_codon:yes gene_type:complete